MREPDEPDRDNPRERHPAEMQREMARIERNDATLTIFPVHWWSVPALLKGWIDRVRNNGWPCGDADFPQRRAWMIGVAARYLLRAFRSGHACCRALP